jgi:hypothetical protein
MEATMEPAGREKWLTFFSVVWYREAFHRLRFQVVAEFDSD